MFLNRLGKELWDAILQCLSTRHGKTDMGLKEFSRCFTGAKPRQANLFGDLFERIIDTLVKFGDINLNRKLDLVVFEGCNSALHKGESLLVGYLIGYLRDHHLGQDVLMPFWKPHALANPHKDQIDLTIGDRVVATVELDGVPEGTEGKVILANGFNWQRYRVLFDNGAELGDLDHRNIAAIGRAAKRLAKAAKRSGR